MGVGHCLVMGESFLVYGLGQCLGDDLDSHLQGGGWIHCLAMCVPLSCEGGGHCLTMGVGTLSCNGWELFLYMGWGSVFVMTRTATCRGGGIHCLAMCVQLSCEWGRALPDHGCDLGLYCVEPCAWSCRGWATVSYLVQHSPARNGGGPSSSGLDMALCWNGWLSCLGLRAAF